MEYCQRCNNSFIGYSFHLTDINWENDVLIKTDYFGVDLRNVTRHRSHLAARVRAYYPSSDSKKTSGESLDESVGLVGVDYSTFLMKTGLQP